MRKNGIDLARRRSWCVGTDPEFASMGADIVGLHLNPPENAVVVCMYEKPCIQRAADYLFKAKLGMFGYVRRWLKWGLVSPKASSLIERVMRELARRIKRIAYGLSDRGVEKVAKIILKRHSAPEEWRRYWEKRNQPNGKVMPFVQNYHCSSTNLAH